MLWKRSLLLRQVSAFFSFFSFFLFLVDKSLQASWKTNSSSSWCSMLNGKNFEQSSKTKQNLSSHTLPLDTSLCRRFHISFSLFLVAFSSFDLAGMHWEKFLQTQPWSPNFKRPNRWPKCELSRPSTICWKLIPTELSMASNTLRRQMNIKLGFFLLIFLFSMLLLFFFFLCEIGHRIAPRHRWAFPFRGFKDPKEIRQTGRRRSSKLWRSFCIFFYARLWRT